MRSASKHVVSKSRETASVSESLEGTNINLDLRCGNWVSATKLLIRTYAVYAANRYERAVQDKNLQVKFTTSILSDPFKFGGA